eukprot:gb/GEZN01013596.1/.p1 GENE.gb/GEZN01013596.1/~~gb/GEZN01013596.1/.p1  ORF type:complete len:226 (-),score=25.13 gb/GEZN01013596.1/:327-953(-)
MPVDKLRKHVRKNFSTATVIPAGFEDIPGLPPSFTSAYGLSSWAYAALGLWALIVFWENELYTGMHLECFASILQSIFSFGCDVLTFGKASRWKVLDRNYATTLFLAQVFKLIWLEMTYEEWFLWAVILCVGLLTYSKSTYHIKQASTTLHPHHFHGFLRWHTAWHILLPFGMALWMLMKYYNAQAKLELDDLTAFSTNTPTNSQPVV